jgi:hypothetical protein
VVECLTPSHILVDYISKILPCDKTLSFDKNNKRNHVYFKQLHKNDLSGLKKLINCFLNVIPSMFVSSHPEFLGNCVYQHAQTVLLNTGICTENY